MGAGVGAPRVAPRSPRSRGGWPGRTRCTRRPQCHQWAPPGPALPNFARTSLLVGECILRGMAGPGRCWLAGAKRRGTRRGGARPGRTPAGRWHPPSLPLFVTPRLWAWNANPPAIGGKSGEPMPGLCRAYAGPMPASDRAVSRRCALDGPGLRAACRPCKTPPPPPHPGPSSMFASSIPSTTSTLTRWFWAAGWRMGRGGGRPPQPASWAGGLGSPPDKGGYPAEQGRGGDRIECSRPALYIVFTTQKGGGLSAPVPSALCTRGPGRREWLVPAWCRGRRPPRSPPPPLLLAERPEGRQGQGKAWATQAVWSDWPGQPGPASSIFIFTPFRGSPELLAPGPAPPRPACRIYGDNSLDWEFLGRGARWLLCGVGAAGHPPVACSPSRPSRLGPCS